MTIDSVPASLLYQCTDYLFPRLKFEGIQVFNEDDLFKILFYTFPYCSIGITELETAAFLTESFVEASIKTGYQAAGIVSQSEYDRVVETGCGIALPSFTLKKMMQLGLIPRSQLDSYDLNDNLFLLGQLTSAGLQLDVTHRIQDFNNWHPEGRVLVVADKPRNYEAQLVQRSSEYDLCFTPYPDGCNIEYNARIAKYLVHLPENVELVDLEIESFPFQTIKCT